jgi:hypothetical protein
MANSVPPDRDTFEILKLQAEIEKAQAERDKIREELRQSKGIYVLLGKTFTPLAAVLSILLTYLAATYKYETAKAQLEKAQAELERGQVLLDKNAAERDLTTAKNNLVKTQLDIARANLDKAKAETSRAATQHKLSQLQNEFAFLKKEQNDQLLFGNLRKLIDILDSEPAQRKIASSRYIEDIRREVAGNASFKLARVSYLATAAQDAGNKPDLRALLYYTLFQATNDNQWLDQIRRLASDTAIDCSFSGCEFVPAFKTLMELQYFDSKDRAALICDMYSRGSIKKLAYKSGIPFNELPKFNQTLYSWDKAATIKCRKPYLNQLEIGRKVWQRLEARSKKNLFTFIITQKRDPSIANLWLTLPGLSSTEIIDLPTQAILIWYLNENSSIKEPHINDIQPNSEFDRFPDELQKAFLSGSTSEWVRQHPKLVTAWTTEGFPYFANASDGTMQKVLSGIWITEADLP